MNPDRPRRKPELFIPKPRPAGWRGWVATWLREVADWLEWQPKPLVASDDEIIRRARSKIRENRPS